MILFIVLLFATIIFGYLIGLTAVLIVVFVGVYVGVNGWKILLEGYSIEEASPPAQLSSPLYETLLSISEKTGISPPKLYVARMETPNAFALGGLGSSAIVISHELPVVLSDEALEAVLAHECYHIKSKDTLLGTVFSVLAGFVCFLRDVGVWRIAVDDDSLPLFDVVVLSVASILLRCGYSRKSEFEADIFSASITSKEAILEAI